MRVSGYLLVKNGKLLVKNGKLLVKNGKLLVKNGKGCSSKKGFFPLLYRLFFVCFYLLRSSDI